MRPLAPRTRSSSRRRCRLLPTSAGPIDLIEPRCAAFYPPTMVGKKRILVADDNVDSADTWRLLLADRGHTVLVAHDGKSACDAAMDFRPQAMLLDVGMPYMSGLDVAKKIRRQPWGHDVLLLAVSGWGTSIDKARASEAGFDHHRTKPADPTEIIDLIEGGAKDA
jgi:DNA-binding response OmpR family regulator